MADETRTQAPELDGDATRSRLTNAEGTTAQAGETATPVGEVVGPPGYELREEVGRGGMGVVYRARDIAIQRDVAVKVLLDRYAPDSGTAARFLDEARITGQLQHPGIPAVHQVGTLPGGRPYLVMKLIKGDTLADKVKAKATLDPLAIFEAIAQAVGYAHAHGVIHRDLKPANVMVGGFGEVQVMGWGLAKVLSRRVSLDTSTPRPMFPLSLETDDPERPTDPVSDLDVTTGESGIRPPQDSDTPFTQYGTALGTPAFMPPEQAAGDLDRIDARADVFGLGAILCSLLTGAPPYEGDGFDSVRVDCVVTKAVRGNTDAAFVRLDASKADPGVIDLCEQCLPFDPLHRPADANTVATTMARLRRESEERTRQAERAKRDAEVRRRVTVRAAVAMAAVLSLGVTGTVVGLVRADASLRAAEAAEGIAATERRDAEVERDAAKVARAAEAAQQVAAKVARAEANALVTFFEERVFVVAGQPRVLPPDHPDTLRNMHRLAMSYEALGRRVESLKLYEATLAARRRVLPPSHHDTLKTVDSVATGYAALGRNIDAVKLFEEALTARRRVLSPDHTDIQWTMDHLAYSYAALGRHADAQRLREEAADARKLINSPPKHPTAMPQVK